MKLLSSSVITVALVALIACSGGAQAPTPTSSPSPTSGPSPVPTATATPDAARTPAATPARTATPEPTATPMPATVPTGTPFSFDDFRMAWEARSMTVTLGGPNAAFKGFGTATFDVGLSRDGGSLEISVLVYADRQAMGEDWELTVGESPVPKEGRILPDHISTWWNGNVAVVVRTHVGDIASDALDAFLALEAAGGGVIRQLAYEGEDRGLWLVNADGSGRRLLTDQCPSVGLHWSPLGDMIACSYFSLVVFDLEGEVIWRTDDTPVSPVAWSPDGKRLAYQASDESLHVVHLAHQVDLEVHRRGLPLAWPQPTRLFVGLNPLQGQLFQTWEAHWLDPDSRDVIPVPRLDNANVWFLPGGERAMVLGKDGLAVFNVETSEEKAVAPIRPSFPGERLPFYGIAVSDDGRHVYAGDASSQPTVIYRVDIDSGDVKELGTIPGVLLRISPGGVVAYLRYGGVPETLYLANLNSGATVEIGPAYAHMAWRPTP